MSAPATKKSARRPIVVGLGAAVFVGILLAVPSMQVRARKLGCRLGHQPSCEIVAGAYETGWGVPADPARATALHREGCERRADPQACLAWGSNVAFGVGGKADVPAAEKLCLDGDARFVKLCPALVPAVVDKPGAEARVDKLLRHACALGDARFCGATHFTVDQARELVR